MSFKFKIGQKLKVKTSGKEFVVEAFQYGNHPTYSDKAGNIVAESELMDKFDEFKNSVNEFLDRNRDRRLVVVVDHDVRGLLSQFRCLYDPTVDELKELRAYKAKTENIMKAIEDATKPSAGKIDVSSIAIGNCAN